MSEADSSKPTRLDEIIAEYLAAVEAGDDLSEAELIATHSEYADGLKEFFADKRQIDRLAGAHEDHEKTPADALAPTLRPTPRTSTKTNSEVSQVGESIRYIGDYELLEEIARGGMGVVYKARQVKLNRIVALKMILAGQLASDQDIKRFYSEAEAAANLDHPGIVPIFEVGEHDGQHYFSMGFVEGESLAERIAQGPLPAKDAAVFVKRIADAVEFAHGKGVIHRDLKPGNILIQKDQFAEHEVGNLAAKSDTVGDSGKPESDFYPRITDFGLAKKLESNSSLTGTGQILGTPSYMSPEQASGIGHIVGPESDVYSIGAILYCALTGRPPFQSANPIDVLIQVAEKEPVSLRLLDSTIPRDLETICLKCLRKDPKKRYQTANELAQDLNRFIHDLPIQARPLSFVEKTTRFAKRYNKVLLLLCATAVGGLVLGTAAIATWSVFSHQKTASEIGLVSIESTVPRSAEILFEDQDELAVPQLSIPTNRPIKLPKGRYRTVVSRPRQLSTLYKINVQPQMEQTFDMADTAPQIWNPISVKKGSQGSSNSYRLLKNPDGTVNLFVRLDETVRCIDFPSGRIKWTMQENAYFLDLSLQPDLNDDGKTDIVVQSVDRTMAVSGTDGELLWEYLGIERPYGFESGHIDADDIFDLVVVGRKNMTAISGDNGKELWSIPHTGGTDWGTRHDSVINISVADTVFYTENSGVVFAHSLRSGKKIWRSEITQNPKNSLMFKTLDDLNGDEVPEVVGVSNRNLSPMLHVFDAPSGQLLWEREFDHDDAFVRYGTNIGADLNNDGYREIYLVFVDNKVVKGPAQICSYALSGENGEIIWSNKFSAPAAYSWESVTLAFSANNGDRPACLFVSQGYPNAEDSSVNGKGNFANLSDSSVNGKGNFAYLLSTVDGLLQSTIPEACNVKTADLDGDNFDDAHWYDSASQAIYFASGHIGPANDPLTPTATSESTHHKFSFFPWTSTNGTLTILVSILFFLLLVSKWDNIVFIRSRSSRIVIIAGGAVFGGFATWSDGIGGGFSLYHGITHIAFGATLVPLIIVMVQRISFISDGTKRFIRKMYLVFGSVMAAFVIGILWLWIDLIGADQLQLYVWYGWFTIIPYGIFVASSLFLFVDILFGREAHLENIKSLQKKIDDARKKAMGIPPKEWFDSLGK